MQKIDNINLGVSETPLRKKFKEYMAEFDNKIGLYKEKENMIRNKFHRKLWLNKFFFFFHLTDIGVFGGIFLALAFAEGTNAGWLYPSTVFLFALAIVSVIINLLLFLKNRNKRKNILIELELEKLYAKEYYLDKANYQCELASKMVIDLMIEYDHGEELEKYKENQSKEIYQSYYIKLETKYRNFLLENKVPDEAHAICAFYENWYKEKIGDIYVISHEDRLALAEFKNKQYIGESGYNERLYQQYSNLLIKYSSYENFNISLYNDAVHNIKEIIDYKNVKKLIDLTSNEIKNNSEKKYLLAKEKVKKEKKQAHKEAIELLKQICEYKDSEELIEKYTDELQHVSKKRKHTNIIVLFIFIFILLIASTIILLIPAIKTGLSYSYVSKAKELFVEKKYEEAIEYYNKAYEKVDEDFYNVVKACDLLENKNFKMACTYLKEVSKCVNIDVNSKYEISDPENINKNVLYNYQLNCVYDNINFEDFELISYDFEVKGEEYIINIIINVNWKVAKKNHALAQIIFIPADMTEIPLSYCKDLNYLTKVVFEENSQLEKIGDFAFYNCRSLKNIVIPDSVTSIGDNAFKGCVSLKTIIIPNSVTVIGYHAFYNCDDLKVYCEAKIKPEGWDDYWSDNCTVFWGYK